MSSVIWIVAAFLGGAVAYEIGFRWRRKKEIPIEIPIDNTLREPSVPAIQTSCEEETPTKPER